MKIAITTTIITTTIKKTTGTTIRIIEIIDVNNCRRVSRPQNVHNRKWLGINHIDSKPFLIVHLNFFELSHQNYHTRKFFLLSLFQQLFVFLNSYISLRVGIDSMPPFLVVVNEPAILARSTISSTCSCDNVSDPTFIIWLSTAPV